MIPEEFDAKEFRRVLGESRPICNAAVYVDSGNAEAVRSNVGASTEFVANKRLQFKSHLCCRGPSTNQTAHKNHTQWKSNPSKIAREHR